MSEQEEQNPQDLVSPEEVQKFLEESALKEQRVPIDLDPEDLQTLAGQEDLEDQSTEDNVEERVNKIDTEQQKDFEPDVATVENQMRWSFEAGENFVVKVEDEDKDLYLKAALTDTELRLKINLPVPGEPIIECKSLTEKESRIIFTALEQDVNDKILSLDTQFNSQMQNYSMCLQVVAVMGKASKYYIEFPKEKSVEDSAEQLRTHFADLEGDLSSMTRGMYVLALRIFTIKTKLCADNMVNENFWKPSDNA